MNDNNNSFNLASPFAVVHPGYAIFDFEIADMDNDGFNDLIIAGVDNPTNGSFYYARVYENYDGVTLGSTPIWSIESLDYIRSFPQIAIDDISKDGFNDLIIVSDGGYSNVFINTKSTPILGTTPDQIFSINLNEHANIWQVKTADIYNTGGKALFTSFQSDGFGPNPPVNERFGLFAINATDYNPPPPPPILTGQIHFDGTFYRPKIF